MRSGVEDDKRGDAEAEGVSGEFVDKLGKEAETSLKVTLIPRPPPSFSQRLVKKTEDGKYKLFITMLKYFSVNVPLIEALEQMPGNAIFIKDMITKKRSICFKDNDQMQNCSPIATRSLVQKKTDPGAYTIPCTIGLLHFARALSDVGASINLMPLSIYKKLSLGDPKPTAMRLLMAYQMVKRPIGILHDVQVKCSHLFSRQIL